MSRTLNQRADNGRELAARACYGDAARATRLGPDDSPDALVDALANLRLWATRDGLDWDVALASAEHHAAVEVDEIVLEGGGDWDTVPS